MHHKLDTDPDERIKNLQIKGKKRYYYIKENFLDRKFWIDLIITADDKEVLYLDLFPNKKQLANELISVRNNDSTLLCIVII